jgi:hypothetical protein
MNTKRNSVDIRALLDRQDTRKRILKALERSVPRPKGKK